MMRNDKFNVSLKRCWTSLSKLSGVNVSCMGRGYGSFDALKRPTNTPTAKHNNNMPTKRLFFTIQ
ncbi:hypothetical protein AAGS61_09145 [Lysinibacillus sp. KU-BSD001]|uniref:hypothetical protein n=1 Tax=Lysinibacillus sp. KU-BSD001 TaxID=3141328 RepID=UPI0036ED8EF9